MSTDYTCKRPQNQIIIRFLQHEMNQRMRHNHAPQTPVPWIKAMKAISQTNMIIQNEWHAKAITDIGDDIANVIKAGLKRVGKYRKGQGSWTETKRAQKEIIKQTNQQIKQRKNKKNIRINKVYIPRENSATRAMFIVLAKSHIADEKGLKQYTIINRARDYTDVDFNASYDTYKLYKPWDGMATLRQHGYVVKKRGQLHQITDKGFQVYLQHCQPQENMNNNNRNNNNSDDDGQLQDVLRSWHTQSIGRQNSNVDNIYDDGNDEQLQKAILESKKSMMKTQRKLKNLNDDDALLQQALLASVNDNNNQRDVNDPVLQAISSVSEQEAILNNIRNHNRNRNNNTNSNYKPYWCPYCVGPRKGYKTRKNFDKHMQKHEGNVNNNNNNSNNNNSNNSNNNNSNNNNNNYNDNIYNNYMQMNNGNNNSIVSSRKRKNYDERDGYNSDIEILSLSPPKNKKHKLSHNRIENDLDKMLKNFAMQLFAVRDKHRNGNVIFNGKRYKLKLWIDTAEQNLASIDINQLDLMDRIIGKNKIHPNNCQFKQLKNADYIFVLSDEIQEHIMLNCAVERKRWDDLERSVLVDGRGKDQIERLKLTPITRKYYNIEGKDTMIGNYGRRMKCKEFLINTEKYDGYMVKYYKSKHKMIDVICEWYWKILFLLNQENGCGSELVINGYTFQQFQDSQKRNVKQNVNMKMLNGLMGMGFDKHKCMEALIAVNNKSVEDAVSYMMN